MIATFLFHFVILFALAADNIPGNLQEERVYTVSEVTTKPEPPGGHDAFLKKWSRSVRYPAEAVREKIQGIVFIEFVVNKDGTIAKPAVRSGIGAACDEAALKGFVQMSKEAWKPGIKNGEPVTVKMVLPFSFTIVSNEVRR